MHTYVAVKQGLLDLFTQEELEANCAAANSSVDRGEWGGRGGGHALGRGMGSAAASLDERSAGLGPVGDAGLGDEGLAELRCEYLQVN